VMWQFSGVPIAKTLKPDLVKLVEGSHEIEEELRQFLSTRELEALRARVDNLLITGCYPQLNPYRNIPHGWW